MQNRKKILGIILLGTVFLVASAICIDLWQREGQLVGQPVLPKIETAHNAEVALTKWLYEHSKQISRRACKEIVDECLKTNKPLLLLAMFELESTFVPTALSNKGAMGLGQVMPVSLAGKDVHEKALIAKGIIKERRDLYDIVPNIQASDYVMTQNLKDAKGDVSKALDLYLGGQDGWYVKRILSTLANLYVLVEENK